MRFISYLQINKYINVGSRTPLDNSTVVRSSVHRLSFMRFTILFIILGFSFSGLTQNFTDSTYYANGKLKGFGIYDSLHKYWKYYGFYESGQIELSKILDSTHFIDTDTTIIYHRNGKIAWIIPFVDSGFLTGKLIGYYQDGSIKREANYYRSFRTGTWKEYFENGKLKAVSYYKITDLDSTYYRNLTAEDYKNGFVETERFTWDDIDFSKVQDSFQTGNKSFEAPTLISKRIGIWKTYDSTGKIISAINYDK